MKKLFIGLYVCVLFGCDATNNTPTSNTQYEEHILVQKENTLGKLDKMIEQQNEIQNKYFNLCGHDIGNMYPKLSLINQRKMCVCFSERMAQFIYSGNQQEFDKYQALGTYKIKIWDRELEKCRNELKL